MTELHLLKVHVPVKLNLISILSNKCYNCYVLQAFASRRWKKLNEVDKGLHKMTEM